jgi:predicted nucleotidyltransferase
MESQLQRGTASQAVWTLQETLGKRLVAVVLFGSRARGDAQETSDWDLLVIAEDLPQRVLERQLLLGQIVFKKCDGAISILAKTPQEFEASVPSLYLDIALDGQILYDPRGYAAEKLATVRRLIERLGLCRESTEAGDLWRWEKKPAGAWALRWEG